MEDAKFPRAEIEAMGYHCAFSGQRTYNGVAILAKQPIEDVLTDIPDLDDPQRRILIGTVAGALLALAAGWWGLREVLRRPVMDTLRRAAD